jgi:hypothetical protein
MMQASVADAREISFPQHLGNGVLTVYSGADTTGVPFPIARVFTLTGIAAGGTRGRHAHRACSQLFVGLSGRVELRVDDGRETRLIVLDDPAAGLLVPPGLWVELSFPGPEAVLVVFCDQPFDESDYIRDRAEFLGTKGLPAEPLGA